MQDAFFLTTIAGLSLSLAGFVGVIAAVGRESDRWQPIQLWRVKTIVRSALLPGALALSLIPLFAITEDLNLTVRLGSLLLALIHLGDIYINRVADAPDLWPSRRAHRIYLLVGLIHIAISAVNLWLANLGLLQLALLLSLGLPGSILANFVRELGGPRSD